MIKFASILCVIVLSLAGSIVLPAQNYLTSSDKLYRNNRQPLVSKKYIELPLGSIRAEGWMKDQLLRASDGMTGHMDSIYSKVMGPDNAWLGGEGDAWERGPYWIDGLLPLAYILDDKNLIRKAQLWVESALASQQESGYFGPDTDRENRDGLQRNPAYDWWPKMVMLKVMQQYYSATEDQRVLEFMTRYFRYQLEHLPDTPLGYWSDWAEKRGGENLIPIYWLYNITGDSFLLELAELIHSQTTDWSGNFLCTDDVARQHTFHCVNLAQGFKEPVIWYQQSKNQEDLESVCRAVEKMRYTTALPTGLWAGDEMMRFGRPTAGSELCTAVEMMFSLENILEITGDMQWADMLEKIAYNVLPTQITDDFSARQYYSQINQISITREWRDFVSPYEDTPLLFGPLTGYPCCSSNMHQGWPKFVQHLWYATNDNGIAALAFAPSSVTAKVGNGTSVHIEENTDYPFDGGVCFSVTFLEKSVLEARFPFHIRIPGWCGIPEISINGEIVHMEAVPGKTLKIDRIWKTGDIISVRFPMDIRISRWYDDGVSIERGPLLYALRMNEIWTRKEFEADKQEYGDWYYEVTSDSPWNYALLNEDIVPERIDDTFIISGPGKVTEYPWNPENAPVIIKTKARRVKHWKEVNGSAGPIAYFTRMQEVLGPEESIELIPYGCTTLRIAEFPVSN